MKNLHKKIGIFAASLLATSSAVYLYSPVIGSHADSSATADIILTVGEVMDLTLDTNSLDLSTTPNNFVSGVINATASTNSQYGYTLTLEDVDTNTNLVHTNENIEATVTSNFSGSKTSSEMEANTWGFSLDATNFSKIPANGSAVTIKSTNVPMTAASETTPVTFGAKVGNLTSGTYTDKVLFTIYTNGQDEPSDMQSFTCDRLSNIGDSVVLTDIRDGNEYTVKKLADGKCWMTDNLRLIGTTITSENSNLPEGGSWTIPASAISGGFDSYNSNSAYLDSTYGGYYTFYTATAGWGTNTTGRANSPKDICPKGWRLPTGGADSEFDTLYNSYEYSELFSGDPSFVFPGRILPYYTNVEERGSTAFYWSSTAYDNTSTHTLYLNEWGGNYSGSSQKREGYSIRCIAKQ